MTTVSIDLGSGPFPRNPYNAIEVWGVDLEPGMMTKAADLAVAPIPFPDGYADYVTAYDFLEHIPRVLYVDGVRRLPFVALMQDVWRVLKPGGLFRAHTPCYPAPEVFVDPTHCNPITEGTVSYFTPGGGATRYGFTGGFDVVRSEWATDWTYWLIWELRAVK